MPPRSGKRTARVRIFSTEALDSVLPRSGRPSIAGELGDLPLADDFLRESISERDA